MASTRLLRVTVDGEYEGTAFDVVVAGLDLMDGVEARVVDVTGRHVPLRWLQRWQRREQIARDRALLATHPVIRRARRRR